MPKRYLVIFGTFLLSALLYVDRPFETDGDNYLRTLAVQEAVYQSAESRQVVRSIGVIE